MGRFSTSTWFDTVYGDAIYLKVTWEEVYGCQYLVLQSAQVGCNGGGVPNLDYWEGIRDASFDGGTGCRFIGTDVLSKSFGNQTVPVNYTFEFWIDDASGCYGDYSYDDLPLS